MPEKKEEDEKPGSNWTFDGEKEEDWDVFDRRMLRHCRKEFGCEIGDKVWLGQLPNVNSMNGAVYDSYCESVWQSIDFKNSTKAWHLWDVASGFYLKSWQNRWRKEKYSLIKDYVEEHSRGAVELEVVNYEGNVEHLRSHLYKQFGAGTSGDIHTKETEYDAGIPAKGQKLAFPKGVNMKDKLRQLYDRMKLFWKMCAPEKRAEYPYCQEAKLVRIVLQHVDYNDDYKECVARLLTSISLKKEINAEWNDADAGGVDVDADLLSTADRSFNNEWLPTWKRLRSVLQDEYVSLEKNKSANDKGGKIPVAFVGEGKIRCYACGTPGHKKGDVNCRAGRDEIHSSAPQSWKDKKARQGSSSGGGGRSSHSPMSVKPCHQFNFGKGNCTYGGACKFSHDVSSSSGQGKGKGGPKGGKFSQGQKKHLSAMMQASMKKVFKNALSKKRKSDEMSDGSGGDDDLAAIIASCMMIREGESIVLPRNGPVEQGALPSLSSQLHKVDEGVGFDSDSALTISCFKKDFLWIDSSPDALARVPSLNGIGGGNTIVEGVGPCMVRKYETGEYFLDPEGILLGCGDGQPLFRVLSQLRFKALGVRLVSCFEDTEDDVLQCRRTKHVVKLSEEGPEDHNGLPRKILVMRTQPCPHIQITKEVRDLVEDVRTGKRSAMIVPENEKKMELSPSMMSRGMALSVLVISMLVASTADVFQTTSMVFNEAKLSVIERSRLYSRRFGYCDTASFPRMNKMAEFGDLPKLAALNEDSVVQDEAKFRKKSHHRRSPETTMLRPCWHRAYSDGYGGGGSLGGESYDGAVGGYLFVCPSTGEKIHKLYASHEQYPAALFQFLTEVEGQGYRCKEVYVDTFSVNISAEAEEVAAMFQCRIVPVSAGTPEEVSFVETAHRVVAGRSRAMLLGAPHLPEWCWALADKYAVHTGRFLPQSTRKYCCAYYLSTGKVPDWRNMCLHVFGAPCKYAPMDGPVHKRAALTEDGYFVGIQHPMALVLRKSDMKLLSVSTKKVKVYESAYIKPLTEDLPSMEDFQHAEVGHGQPEGSKDGVGDGASISQNEVNMSTVGGRVQSVKSVRQHTIPTPHSTATELFREPTTLDDSANLYSVDPGEGEYVPEHKSYSQDQLRYEIEKLKERVIGEIAEPGIRMKVMASLKKASSAVGREVERGALKVGKKSSRRNDAGDIKTDNIRDKKRMRRAARHPPTLSTGGSQDKPDSTKKTALRKSAVGDLISASPTVFDGDEPGSWSNEKPARCYGIVTKTLAGGKVLQVRWTEGDGTSTTKVRTRDVRTERKKATAEAVLSVMLVEGEKAHFEAADKSKWPTDFFQALVKSDWRDWVSAVKKEISSWHDFDAYTEIPFEEKTPGASIVPLGELFTRKRDLSYKFRQYLMGNLLKYGKDFVDTFSSTVSWDGIRWCASVACCTGKEIYGLDAVTGFLQASEKFDLYAFVPSHGGYSSMSFEELAVLRKKLLDLVSKDGEQGLKKFAALHKRESRVNPKKCYRLNSSIYGAPSANYEWEALFQGTHINHCGLTLSQVEPSLLVKIQVDKEDRVVEWLIAKIWTDDVRYFGTDGMRKQYEAQISEKIKVKFLGVPREFVGTEFLQDLEKGLLEMKSPKYWELAAERFKNLFPHGPKARRNAMTLSDERTMFEEVSDEQHEEAKRLPYRELCGVISYPSACSKLEMRYCVSLCGSHRTKWGVKQFDVLKKAFEYGYTTREMGLLYSQNLDSHGKNTLYCYADSGHSAPRSQGCSVVMQNGAAIAMSTKKHTITAASTCHDELIEFSIACNKVAGFRNLCSETGLHQKDATVIYQDNEAAVKIETNRGSLSSRSKHIDLKVLSARNKVEDQRVIPVLKNTTKMIADIGTKALPDGQFEYLRDEMNGYSLVKANHPSYELPSYVYNGVMTE